jgi:RNA polymerase sigma factor (sigma-70 family)
MEDIIKGCKKGDPLAQRKLYDSYKSRFMGMALRYTSSREQAQDVLQESFIKIFTKMGSFDSKGTFEGWMTRIVINTAISLNRKWDYRKVGDDIMEYDSIEEAPGVIDQISHKELLDMVSLLPTGYRTVFNLYAIDGFTHPEISKMTGIAEGTSKSQLSRAKAILAAKIQKIKNNEKKILNENAGS